MKGVSALLADDSFRIASALARSAHETADCVYKWIQEHQDQITTFEKKLTEPLTVVLRFGNHFKNWTGGRCGHHTTSDSYISAWQAFLQKSGNSYRLYGETNGSTGFTLQKQNCNFSKHLVTTVAWLSLPCKFYECNAGNWELMWW